MVFSGIYWHLMIFILMLIGTLAITGIPPFAGFYSKDAIIEALFDDEKHHVLSNFSYILSIITVLLTSFYSWKLIFKIFFTRNSNVEDHSHESSFVIILPMFLLSIFSIGAGFLLEKYFGILNEAGGFWTGAISMIKENEATTVEHASYLIKFLPLILSISGMLIAYYFYIMRDSNAKSLTYRISPRLYNLFASKFYIDEIYNFFFVKPAFVFASFFSFCDKSILDKYGPNGIRNFVYYCSGRLKKAHNGLLYKYNFWQFCVLVFVVAYFVLLAGR